MSNKGNLSYDDVIFFDLETSGLDARKHQIIQIAALHAPTGDTYEKKLKFSLERAEPKALETVGFDLQTWRHEAVSQQEGLEDFCNWTRSYAWMEKFSRNLKPYNVAVMAGWRIDRFDVPFLLHQLESRGIWAPFELRVFDVFQLALWACPGLDDYTLSGVSAHLGVELKQAHDAFHDVTATAEVAKCLLKEIWDEDSLPGWVCE